jgi:hypothetical protein
MMHGRAKKTAAEILRAHGISAQSTSPGRRYYVCPQCSSQRKKPNQKLKPLGVTIDDAGVKFGCNHCGWKGGEKFEQRSTSGSSELGPIKQTFDYVDESGALLFQVLRFEPIGRPKEFRQRTGPDQKKWSIKGVRIVPFMLPELIEDIASEHPVFVVEGEKDVQTLRSHNVPATCNPMGAGKWRDEFNRYFTGAEIVIIPDNDQPGCDHARHVAQNLSGIASRVRVLDLAKHWPEIKQGGDVSEWLAAGHSREEFDALVERAPDWKGIGKAEKAAVENLIPCTLDETLAVFERWLILPDRTPVYAVLGTIAANLLPGDPVWLGLIAPPSSAKTEILNSISTLPYVRQAATLTPAGLLSGTPKKQHATGAVGGLLRQIGGFGIISLKDFGSVLSMRPDAKAEVLAALREIFDGAWTRHLGTDGGRTLDWRGKLGMLFGVTGVIDSHYSVIGAMGDRFLFNRMAPGTGQLKRALQHVGTATAQMRKELAEAVARLFAAVRPEPRPLSEAEFVRLDRVVSLVVRLRGAVERDRYSREIEAVYGAEGTARLGLTLERLLAGLDTLGVERALAMNLIEEIAMDSVPPLRRAAYQYLCKVAEAAELPATPEIARVLDLPTTTVRRALEDLAAYKLVKRIPQGQGKPDLWIAVSS